MLPPARAASAAADRGAGADRRGGLRHPRSIARIIFPDYPASTTPPHQDYVHIQATEAVWAAWIPLGDCPKEMGGLTLMPGSHRQGL